MATSILRRSTEPAKIGDILTVDVLLDRETKFDIDVSEYPVEDGFPVSDHVTRKPLTLSMTCVFTPTPATWNGRQDSGRLSSVAQQLQEIYKKGEPITVTLPDAIYPNMVMTHAPLPRTVSDGICYRMQIDFVQVRIVKQKTEEIQEGSTDDEAQGMAGESEKDAGASGQEEIGTGMVVRGNQNVVETNTTAADYANAGDISTKREFTAHAAALALALSFSHSWRL